MAEAPAQGFVAFIYTPDPERSWRFYGEALGLPLVRDEGAARVFRVAGKAYLGVCRASEARPCVPDGICLSIVADDVEAWHERLTAAGVATEGPPERLDAFGVTSFFLRDPDGHLVEIQRFDEPLAES